MPFKQKKLAIIISTLCLAGPASLALAQDSAEVQGESAAQEESALQLPAMSVRGRYLSQDEQGHNNVYQENVTSVYQGREELQRFQVTNPGDVFKGMNGVYSMDTRSSQAITPNIRGITGEGRTPLTIDGTEQSTNVWLHMFGAGNRSYADPALFRSIEVEKGPSLSRGIKSGVGGAVNIRTIEADDIIPQGDSWGIEANLRTSSNTKKSRNDPGSYYGKDYRDIPGSHRMNVNEIYFSESDPRTRGNGGLLNLDDNAGMLALAGRNNVADILVSYSRREQGNYYAGKNNASRYSGHDPYNTSSTDAHFPNLTKLYYGGDEVFNTDSEVKTTLLKNNWYLPNEQKIGLHFMRTDMTFGETTPGNTLLNWALREGFEQGDIHNEIDWSTYPRMVSERPRSEMEIDSYRISYAVKPEGSKWLDLETSVWRTETSGKRYQTGANPYVLNILEGTQEYRNLEQYDYAKQAGWLDDPVLGPIFEAMGEHDGTIVGAGRQWTAHDRTGIEVSNQMLLSEGLKLTLAGSYQEEKLDEKVDSSDVKGHGLFPGLAGIHKTTDFLGPRSGERKEYSAMLNLAWQPTSWLTMTAGTRYMHYKGKDIGTAKRRRQQDAFYEAARRKAGTELAWGRPLTRDELEARNALGTDRAALEAFDDGREIASMWYNGWRYRVWKETAVVPLKDGKLDSSKNPFANGEIDPDLLYKKTIEASGNNSQADQIIANIPGVIAEGVIGKDVYETLDASQGWAAPEEQSGDAFSPVIGATVRITPYGTAFIRYAQTTRFPSLNELTSTSGWYGTEGTFAINGAGKPERSINWEIGYAHDLHQFFPNLPLVDVRISYYNTKIKDFIDRSWDLDTIQFDKKESSGIELQSRFDSGRYFGGLGATYRLEQKTCDKDYASGLDPYYNRIPTCITGGFYSTSSGNSLQPEYSVDLLLGTRLLNDKLELGWRSVYHAEAKNKDLDKLLASEAGASISDWLPRDMWYRSQGMGAFHWKSVLLHDLYANFNVSDTIIMNLGVTNITDEYYIDPMSKVLLPAPGRTVTAGVKMNF